MTTKDHTTADLATVADQIAAALCSARIMEGRGFIRTPILFASGTALVAVIEAEPGGTWRISDLGQGHEEAVQLGVASSYIRRARLVAEAEGVALHGHELAMERIGEARLAAACAVLCSLVLRLVEHARATASAVRQTARKHKLIARLTTLFPDRRVEEDAVLRGNSTKEWTIAALLEGDGIRVAFDLVQPHLTSVAMEVTKAGDLRSLDRAPHCVSVVRRKSDFGPMLALLSQASRVVEEAAPDQTFRRSVA